MKRMLLLWAAVAVGSACKLVAAEPAAQSVEANANQTEIDRLIRQLESDDLKKQGAAQESLLQIGEPALPALRAIADRQDTQQSQSASRAIVQIVNASLAKWLEDKEAVRVAFVGPIMDLQELRRSVKSAASLPDEFQLTPGEGGGTGGAFLTVEMTVTPPTTKLLLAVQEELEPRGYRLDPRRSKVWAYKADEELRQQARKLVPDVAAAVEKVIKAEYPQAEIAYENRRSHLVWLDYKVPGTNVNGLLRIHETTRPSQFWQISAVPDQQFHFPRLGLMVIAYYRPGRDGGGDKSPEQVAIRKEIKGCLAPLLKLEQEAGVEKN